MSRDEDWFGTLSLVHKLTQVGEDRAAPREMKEALSSLEKVLEGGAGPRALGGLRALQGFRFALPPRLSTEELRWAERLEERLWQIKGPGRNQVEEALLGLVAFQARPDSLPFFRAAVEVSRERDFFQRRRRSLAVAAVAFIAHQAGDAAAHALLESWLAHPDVLVRTEAVSGYARIHLREDGTLGEAARAVLERVAYEDRAFPPRFLARGRLRAAGVPLRVEPPDGVYAFKASLGRVSRTVELPASESLAHLASAILSAFRWDEEHLYEFAFTGDLEDPRFILPDREDQAPRSSLPALGALGFTEGHPFLFHYDFGDNHCFQVEVVDIQEHRGPRERYPRVVEETGRAPEQYSGLA